MHTSVSDVCRELSVPKDGWKPGTKAQTASHKENKQLGKIQSIELPVLQAPGSALVMSLVYKRQCEITPGLHGMWEVTAESKICSPRAPG